MLVAVLVALLVGWLVFRQSAKRAVAPESGSGTQQESSEATSQVPADNSGAAETVVNDQGAPSEEPVGSATVVYTGSGFSPSTITVKVGTRVTFQNQSSGSVWPASAIHPTHTVYPGSSISLCGTASAASIFDACGAVAPGGSWSFTFNEVGTWRYHNHLQAAQTGTIVVVQ